MKLSTGDTVVTVSGRCTKPFPLIDISNNRKAINTVKRVDEWLHTEAIEEAKYTSNDYVLTIFPKIGTKLTQSDKDCMEIFLFG